MRLPVWRQKAYIWSFPACAPGGGFNLVWTLCLSFQCERQMEWQTEWETEEQRKGHEEKQRRMGSGWYWSLDLLGAVLLLLSHPAFVAQYNLDYSELYISALLLWLWLTALKNTLTNLLHHGCSQCSSNSQGQHSAAEYWSAHKCELNRMAMIDLKCGASSLKQICSSGNGDLFCGGKGRLSTVEFSISNATTHLHDRLKCDASHVLNATVWI